MDGSRLVVAWHVHGALGGNATFRYKLPCDATLVRVDSCSTANEAGGTLIVGPSDNTDGYIASFTPGYNATFVTKERGDFDGAEVADTNECPHIAKGTVLVVTWTDSSNTDADVALTFLEG